MDNMAAWAQVQWGHQAPLQTRICAVLPMARAVTVLVSLRYMESTCITAKSAKALSGVAKFRPLV